MLTRTGRVVIMDFGLTAETGTGSLAGTPAYMAPEQGRGEPVDARADVFSAGMVLAEMLSAEAGPEQSSRQTFWEAMRQQPPEVPDSPWKPILQRALRPLADDRFATAEELSRALEEVAFRVEGAEHEHPYPGLASFQEEDAEFFFGREAEVEALWQKLDQAHLLALVGASGSGKSSLVNAGLLPARPEGWSCLRMAPGRAPFANLGRTLLTELEGDPQATEALVALEDPEFAHVAFQLWRSRHDQALLIVDQFEELFTQSSEDVQRRFAELLGRAALDADVHVLLSMRDDFLIHCQRHSALRPITSELTLVGPPTGSALRRAIVQPALRSGYRFEDDAVVEAMLEEVNRELGALPLIAFTAARLWEQRDHDTGYLTSEAYENMGGVGGALAQHADATLEAIGEERIPIVRELFRNLVTAQGTRATRDREELLSVFDSPVNPEREAAEEVLDALIDARLLTSYEIPGEGDDGGIEHHRIEIIHESLLAAWPRLVRWQDQDRASAQLRDELRHQAELWQQHDRSTGYLWTGSAYREFELWRENYPGGLSQNEEAYVEAMVAHAERRKRQRRAAILTTISALAIVAAVLAGFWRQAVAEGLRAEASSLYTQAQMLIDEHPTGALAYATAALERHDSREVREFVMDALWRGPTELRLAAPSAYGIDLSPDGNWLVTARGPVQSCYIWPAEGCDIPSEEDPPTGDDLPRMPQFDETVEASLAGDRKWALMQPRISPRGDLMAAVMGEGPGAQSLVLWTFPEGRWLRSHPLPEGTVWWLEFSPDGERIVFFEETGLHGERELAIRTWPVVGGEDELVARPAIYYEPPYIELSSGIDPSGQWLAWVEDNLVRVAPFDGRRIDESGILTIEHESQALTQWFDHRGRRLATRARAVIKIWSLESGEPRLLRTFEGGGFFRADFSPTDSYFAWQLDLFDLSAPVGALPLRLQNAGSHWTRSIFNPDGRWLVTGFGEGTSFWPLARRYPVVLPYQAQFLPDGRHLLTHDPTRREVRLTPLDVESDESERVLYRWGEDDEVADPPILAADGSLVFRSFSAVRVLPPGGGPMRELGRLQDRIVSFDVGPHGRFVAAGGGRNLPAEGFVRVWDLESGEERVIDDGVPGDVEFLRFLPDGNLMVFETPQLGTVRGSEDARTLQHWSLSGHEPSLVSQIEIPLDVEGEFEDLSPDGKQLLFETYERDGFQLLDVESGSISQIRNFLDPTDLGSRSNRNARSIRFGPRGDTVISMDADGSIRVGRLGEGEPHLLKGPWNTRQLDVSPDGQWIAAIGPQLTVLWPMPDLSQPPLHTLPHDELIAKLRTLTNWRAVPDPDSASGWKLEVGPFPGWEEVPTW